MFSPLGALPLVSRGSLITCAAAQPRHPAVLPLQPGTLPVPRVPGHGSSPALPGTGMKLRRRPEGRALPGGGGHCQEKVGSARWALPWGKVSFARMEGGFCQVGTARWTQPEKKVGSARQAKVSSARWALLGWKVGFAMGKAGHCQVSSVLGSPVPQGRPGHSVLLSLSPRDPRHGPGPFLPALGWFGLKPGVFGVCSLAWLLFGGCWSWGLQQVKDRTSAGCRDRVGTGGELLWSPALPCPVCPREGGGITKTSWARGTGERRSRSPHIWLC